MLIKNLLDRTDQLVNESAAGEREVQEGDMSLRFYSGFDGWVFPNDNRLQR